MPWFPCCCQDPVPEKTCAGSCTSDRSPEFWHVDIPSPWNDDDCTGCAGLPGEWIVPHFGTSFDSCTWLRNIRPDLSLLEYWAGSTPGCTDIIANPGIARIIVTISRFGSPVVYQANVSVQWGGSVSFGEDHLWRLQQSEPFSCLSPITVPHHTRTWLHAGTVFACEANNQDIVITPSVAP